MGVGSGGLGVQAACFWVLAVNIYIFRQLLSDGCLFFIIEKISEGSIETSGDLSNIDTTKI